MSSIRISEEKSLKCTWNAHEAHRHFCKCPKFLEISNILTFSIFSQKFRKILKYCDFLDIFGKVRNAYEFIRIPFLQQICIKSGMPINPYVFSVLLEHGFFFTRTQSELLVVEFLSIFQNFRKMSIINTSRACN